MVVTKLREMKPIRCLGIERRSKEGEAHVFVKVEGREPRILLGQGLTEMKPINFGSVKAEGTETNTVLGY